jgi:predicted GTPase
MNDKIKQLLENAEQSDAIAINKWRIENREQRREQRKKELKELMEKEKTMSNNKQSSIEWLVEQIKKDINLRLRGFDIDKALEQAEAMRKDEIKNAQMDMFNHLNNLPYGLEYLEKRQSAEDFSQQYYNETFGGNND